MKTCTAAILLSVLLPFQACSDGKSSKGLKFAELSNDSLFSIGSALLRDPLTADSAIICFAILADRFEKSPRSGGNQELHAKALTNLGYLFSNFRSDYPKAYSYLADALDICKKNGYKSIEPYICLDIGVAIEAYGSLRQNHSDTDSLCEKYLVQAMEMSEKTENGGLICSRFTTWLQYTQRVPIKRPRRLCSVRTAVQRPSDKVAQ